MKKIINYIKNNKKNTLIYISLTLFILITYLIFNKNIEEIDKLAHTYVISLRKESLTNILLIITNISSATSLILISILLFFIIKNKKTPMYILLNLFIAFITSQIAKQIFTRNRPLGINLIEETGYSYPSGHAMVSMAYFGFIAYLIYKNYHNKTSKYIIITLISILILLIGISRIYLGVHYLSDIIGGFLLSILYLMIYIKITKPEEKK